jgi:hypothetical protein
MIENRFRLEKQILRGRQAVRKLLKPSQSKSQPGASTEPLPTKSGIDMPLAMDTDAEHAFSHGAEHFWRRGSRLATAHPDDGGEGGGQSRTEETRRDLRRRKAVSDLFVVDEDEDHPGPPSVTPDTLSDRRNSPKLEPIAPPSPNTFFSRLRAPSFPSLPSPFASMRRSNPGHSSRPNSTYGGTQNAWSSDSSSEDELDRRSAHRFSFEHRESPSYTTSPRAAEHSDDEWAKEEPEVDV